MSAVPNGFFAEGMILYGNLEKGSSVAKGFRIEPPCLRSAGLQDREAYYYRLRDLLHTVKEKHNLQIQWSCNSNYRKELIRYNEDTQCCKSEYIRKIRNKRFAYFWEKMEKRQLRREELIIFPSVNVESYSGNFKTKKGLRSYYESVLGQMGQHFNEFENIYRNILGHDTRIQPMGDLEHFLYFKIFLNPSLEERSSFNAEENFEPSLSIQENCMNGEGVPVKTGFYLDGYVHAILSIKRWPRQSYFGIVNELTGLPLLGYRITANIDPISVDKELSKEERELQTIQGEYLADPSKRSRLQAIEKKKTKIDSLASSFVVPLQAEVVIRIWAKTELELQTKANTIKQAINNMNGAQCFECPLSTTAKNLFFKSWPGNRTDKYPYRKLYAEDSYLANLIPFSSTFMGKVEGAEALYDGNQGNLVGLKTFEENTPQHTVLFGMTGAGKSVHMQDILEQTEVFYGYTAIIEEGLSYVKYTEGMGEKPIIIEPDGELTINYFDTRGFPLSSEQMAMSVALVGKMIGECSRVEASQLRQAQLTQYFNVVYDDSLMRWEGRNQERKEELKRIAYATFKWKQEKMPPQSSFIEAFSKVKAGIKAKSDEVLQFMADVEESEISSFINREETEIFYRNVAFAYFKPEDFPTHTDLTELMLYSPHSAHDKQSIKNIGTLLEAWTSRGQYGKLFDGVTNIDLRRRVAHFELGQINDNATELKTACGLLIAGFVRQHIVTLPRGLRKRIIFEEVARFLDVPGGEKIVREAYAQLRKFACCATSIVQQYSQFKHSAIRPVIMGNAKQFWIMKQQDRNDLEDMSKDINLPDSIIDSIQRYPLPEHLPTKGKFSSICYYSPVSEPAFCGTMRNVQLKESHELQKVAS